jgi:hypothetical protein
MGIIENKFNSKPIHMVNQFEDDKVKIVLNINIDRNIILVKFKFIRKKNIILYLKYESKSFFSLFF